MKRVIHSVLLTLILVASSMAIAQDKDYSVPGTATLNGEMRGQIVKGEFKEHVSGRVSGYFHIAGTGNEIRMQPAQLNVVFFGVPQGQLTGRRSEKNDLGPLGFSLNGEPQNLKYDARSNTFVGELKGQVSLPQFREMSKYRRDPKDDVVLIPKQPATLSIRIKLETKLDDPRAYKEVMNQSAIVSMSLTAEDHGPLDIAAYQIEIPEYKFEYDWGIIRQLEAARSLCVQPVRDCQFTGTSA